MKQKSKTSTSSEKTSAEKAAFELCLINREIFGAIVLIIAYVILIISAEQDRQQILQEQAGVQGQNPNLNPVGLAAAASWLTLTGVIILAGIAFQRLEELQSEVQSGSSKTPLMPNINIAAGYILSILANTIKAIGVQQRYELQQPVVIL
ncbi:MAG: hypothetical protein Q8930_15030 [Bacillota bacterium]|nr:hypothetical protein [Bacillota bacterium]